MMPQKVLWRPFKAFIKTFWGTTKKWENKNLTCFSSFGIGTGRVKYCLLMWMFHKAQTKHKINRLHEITLRIVYNDYVASFQDLLNEDNSLTIHQQEPFFVWNWRPKIVIVTKLPDFWMFCCPYGVEFQFF